MSDLSDLTHSMSEAPRDGTVIVAWHKTTSEPMAVQIWAESEAVRGMVDYRGLWRALSADPRHGYQACYVREEYLSGWCALPAMPKA